MLQGHMICAGWSHWAICLSLLVGQDNYGCLSGAPDVGQSLCLSSSLCPFGPKDVAQTPIKRGVPSSRFTQLLWCCLHPKPADLRGRVGVGGDEAARETRRGGSERRSPERRRGLRSPGSGSQLQPQRLSSQKSSSPVLCC